ncbi:MAG: ketosynthase [Steroidobacter sp.]
MASALALTYPVFAHLAIARGSVVLAVAALGALAAAALLPALARGRIGAWITAALFAYGCWRISQARIPELPLYAPPVLVPAFMAWIFGQSLLRGRTPLIAQLIRHMHTTSDVEPEPGVWAYARTLTWGWTLLFVTIATVNLVLAALAKPDGLLLASGITPRVAVPQEWWSLFANVIGYLLVAAFFVIEYAWRRHRFPQQPYRNMFDFFRRMLIAMPRLLGRD